MPATTCPACAARPALRQAAGLGLRGEDILIWLRSDEYTVQASIAEWKQAGSPAVFYRNPPLVEGQVLTLRDMDDGEYTVRWYDPQSGTWLDTVEVMSHGERQKYASNFDKILVHTRSGRVYKRIQAGYGLTQPGIQLPMPGITWKSIGMRLLRLMFTMAVCTSMWMELPEGR